MERKAVNGQGARALALSLLFGLLACCSLGLSPAAAETTPPGALRVAIVDPGGQLVTDASLRALVKRELKTAQMADGTFLVYIEDPGHLVFEVEHPTYGVVRGEAKLDGLDHAVLLAIDGKGSDAALPAMSAERELDSAPWDLGEKDSLALSGLTVKLFPAGTDLVGMVSDLGAPSESPRRLAPGTPEAGGDTCGAAVAIPPLVVGTPYTDSGNISANTSSGVTNCGASTGSGHRDVWWSFTGTGGPVRVQTCAASGFDTVIEVRTGTCGSTTCVANDDDGCAPRSILTLPTTSGTTYYVRVRPWSGSVSTGAYNLTVEALPAPPANDTCAGAIAVAVPSSTAGTTSTATSESTVACGAAGARGTNPGVWYSFTGTGGGVRVSTCNAATGDFDTQIKVYTGTCASPSCVGGNDDSPLPGCQNSSGLNRRSTVDLCSTVAGQTYYVLVHGFGAQSGPFQLDLSTIPGAPANDLCANATPVANPSITPGTTVCATNTAGTPVCGPGSNTSPDVWYTVVGDGFPIEASLCNNTAMDTVLAVYTGGCAGPLTCLSSDDDGCGVQSRVVFPTTNGTMYWIRVRAFGGTTSGPFELSIQRPPNPPANDLCTSAETLAVPDSDLESTTFATPDNDFGCGPFQQAQSNSVWYEVTGTGRVIDVSVCGATFDTVLSVICGNCVDGSCGTFDDDACGAPNSLASELSFPSELGRPYLIRVSGWTSAESGDFEIVTEDGGPNPAGVRTLCTPCQIVQPGNRTEVEPCGTHTNDACFMATPDPLASEPILPGDVINGTAFLSADDIDTDTYRFTLPGPGKQEVFVDVEADFQALFGVLDGTPPGSGLCPFGTQYVLLNEDACQTGTRRACLAPGTYWAAIQPFINGDQVSCGGGESDYSLGLRVGGPCGPPNDACDDAIPVGVPSSTQGTTVDASPDGAPFCGTSNTAPGVWYEIVGTGNSITVSTCNDVTDYDTKLSVFCEDCDPLACVGGNDDGGAGCALPSGFNFESRLTFCSQPGATYKVLVHGFTSAEGNFQLDVTDNGTPCTGAVQCLPEGACCYPDSCAVTTESNCVATGGTYVGDGVSCDEGGRSVYVATPNAAIPDNNPAGISDTIQVADSYSIADLDVDLTIDHTWVGDLIVRLTHGSTTVTLIDRPGAPPGTVGCSANNYDDIFLSDEGLAPIESQCVNDLSSPPSYIPNNPLAAFDGVDVSGDWTLSVSDNAGADLGTLVQWSLHVVGGGVLTPAAPRPAQSAQSVCSAPTRRTFRVDCPAPAQGGCGGFSAKLVATNHAVDPAGACQAVVEERDVECGSTVTIQLAAPPCTARSPQSARSAFSANSAGLVATGESVVLVTTALNCCGQPIPGTGSTYDPAAEPSPLCDDVLDDGTCCPAIAQPPSGSCRGGQLCGVQPVTRAPDKALSTGRTRSGNRRR